MVDNIESGRLIIINAKISLDDERIKKMQIDVPCEKIRETATKMNVKAGELVTVLMILNDYEIDEEKLDTLSRRDFVRLRNRLMRLKKDDFVRISNVYDGMISDIEYFPVPQSNYAFPWVSFVNSWGNERTYGGERRHEGTDIMADQNTPGVYPILAVCDGTVANMGWLELGGYRIGIKSDHGIYYYYAHMSSYADLKEGDHVSAGQFLGFMGNTGYSKIEGTSGKFDVHLHFGIYIYDENGDEIAVNSYFLLKHLENKVLYYNYGL